jgi:hypothetical protein
MINPVHCSEIGQECYLDLRAMIDHCKDERKDDSPSQEEDIEVLLKDVIFLLFIKETIESLYFLWSVLDVV